MAGPLIGKIEGSKIYGTVANCVGNICECHSDAIDALLNANNPHGTTEEGLK